MPTRTRAKTRPGALTRVCEVCLKRIDGSSGYIAVNFAAAASIRHGAIEPFHIWHERCDPHRASRDRDRWHRIEAETADELLSHIASLVEKRWFSSTGWQSLFRRIVADAQWYPTSLRGNKWKALESESEDNDENDENDEGNDDD